MIKILHLIKHFLKLKKYLPVGLLVLWCGVSLGQTTISSGSTVNASSIAVGNDITMESNSVLNMDVSRTFGVLIADRSVNGGSTATISGSGTATFSTILVDAGGGQNGSTLTLVISSESTVNCASLSAGTGNRNKSASIQGTLRLSGGGSPISTGWTTFSIGSSSTIEYNGGEQTVFQSTTDSYNNLILSGSGTKTLQSSTTSISGNLALAGTSSASTAANLSVGGDLTIGNSTALTIETNFTFTVSGNSIIGGGSSGTLNLAGTGTKSFSGNVLINSGGTWNESGSGSIAFGGDLQNNGTFTSNGSAHTFSGTSKSIGGSNPISIPNATVTGSYTNSTYLSIATALAGSGSLVQGVNSNLTLGGTSGITTLNASTNCPNTVTYSGAAQTVKGINYCNLTLSGSGTKTLQSGTTSISDNLVLSGTSSASTPANLSVGGDLTIGNSTALTIGTNFTFTVSGNSTIGAGASGTLNLAGTGIKSFTGNVLINSGGTWNESGSGSIAFGGDLQNNGTFTSNGSVHTFSGTGKSIGGTNPISIPNATVTGSYTNNTSLSIATALEGSGSLVQGVNSNLILGGSSGITTLNASTNCPNTVTYSGAAQTVKGVNYCNLTLNGSGTKTLQSGTTSILGNLILAGTITTTAVIDLSIGENLDIGTGSTFGAGSFAHSIGGNFTRSGTFTAGTSTLVFNRAGAQNIAAGNYHNLQLAGSGDKTFLGPITTSQELRISGTAISRLGSVNHTANTLYLGGIGQQAGTYGSTASSAFNKEASYFGTTDTGILTSATDACTLGIWLGTTSSNWFEPTNWCGGIPAETTDILIPSTAPNQPIINANGAEARNIRIQTGASLEISGTFTLSVYGDWINEGSFIPEITSAVDFTGANSAEIGSASFANISFTGTGTKTINSTFTLSGIIDQVSTHVVLSGSNTLTLNSGKIMEISSSGSLTTPGTGKLILEPGSNYVNRSTSNPRLEVKQTFVGDKGWRMIGIPISTTYENLTSGLETQGFPGSTNPTLQPNLLWWDETDKGTTLQGWRQPANLIDAIPAGRGHYFYVFDGDTKPGGGNYSDALPKTISVTGTEVNLSSDIFDFGVTFTARDTNLVAQADTLIEVNQADEGFNMLANPTASVIDFHSGTGWIKTNIDQAIYVWDPEVGDFLTWNGTTGSLGSGRIAPFQAFWVKANAASPVLELSGNGAKSLSTTDFNGRKLSESQPTLELNVVGEGLRARSYITFGPDGKAGADPKDAYQLESLAEDWLLLYSFGSLRTRSPLVINHQPDLTTEDRVIPLHLAASKKGEPFKGTYLMNWAIPAEWPASTEIVLMDHINQKAIDMRTESMHSFSFEAPKAPVSNARKMGDGMKMPQTVVFQTPYEVGEEEEVSLSQARVSASEISKPKRPFTIYIGGFPNDQIEYLPDLPRLFAPVPNPFQEETKIRFFLPESQQAEVVIYDLLGKPVGNFPAENYAAGITELTWIPSVIDLPNGMYIIRLVTENYSFTQKLIKN